MISSLEQVAKKAFNLMGLEIMYKKSLTKVNAIALFHSDLFLRHNQRRQEHLASLGLNIAGFTVLEVGAGIGDHSSFFIDRGCNIVISEARKENLEIIQLRYPNTKVLYLDLNEPSETFEELFDIVYCYGALYHTHNPEKAIEFMANCCKKMLLVDTCVSFGNEELINPVSEDTANPSQSISGIGCRPTRKWIYNQLKKHFEYVYLPITQPNHEEFPLDWASPELHKSFYIRAVFVASREKIDNELLEEAIPMKQKRSS